MWKIDKRLKEKMPREIFRLVFQTCIVHLCNLKNKLIRTDKEFCLSVSQCLVLTACNWLFIETYWRLKITTTTVCIPISWNVVTHHFLFDRTILTGLSEMGWTILTVLLLYRTVYNELGPRNTPKDWFYKLWWTFANTYCCLSYKSWHLLTREGSLTVLSRCNCNKMYFVEYHLSYLEQKVWFWTCCDSVSRYQLSSTGQLKIMWEI